jgi:hypothetical protein
MIKIGVDRRDLQTRKRRAAEDQARQRRLAGAAFRGRDGDVLIGTSLPSRLGGLVPIDLGCCETINVRSYVHRNMGSGEGRTPARICGSGLLPSRVLLYASQCV